MIVAIDGPAGSGKSATARRLAQRLGFLHLDSGAIYRAFTLLAMRRKVELEDPDALAALIEPGAVRLEPTAAGPARVLLYDEDVSAAIRTPDVTASVAYLARVPAVRERITAIVRAMAVDADVVTEGRDTTTVIFPDADLKLFVDADPRERARRRGLELEQRGTPVPFERLLRDIEERDRSDRDRAVGPLRLAPDAERVDTTGLGLDEVVDLLARRVEAVRR